MRRQRLDIELNPSVLRWARARARLDIGPLARKLDVAEDVVRDWESSGRITFSRAERLATATHTPFGKLFLSTPPDRETSVPDFRTVGDKELGSFSPGLVETLHLMQRRQMWMREILVDEGATPLPFVGSVDPESDPSEWAVHLRQVLNLDEEWASRESNWATALRTLRDRVDEAGVLIVFNGVVGNNTHWKLDPDEFRGFALVDDYAPLLFINGADFKSAQMFTLAHEMMHLLVGESGVFDLNTQRPARHTLERRCNAAAGEFLVPAQQLTELWPRLLNGPDPFQAGAKRFKVSTFVVARRALDLGLINRGGYGQFYQKYLVSEHSGSKKSGGDFWSTQGVRIGDRFGSAVIRATRDGRLTYKDAWSLTGLKSTTFDTYVRQHVG